MPFTPLGTTDPKAKPRDAKEHSKAESAPDGHSQGEAIVQHGSAHFLTFMACHLGHSASCSSSFLHLKNNATTLQVRVC